MAEDGYYIHTPRMLMHNYHQLCDEVQRYGKARAPTSIRTMNAWKDSPESDWCLAIAKMKATKSGLPIPVTISGKVFVPRDDAWLEAFQSIRDDIGWLGLTPDKARIEAKKLNEFGKKYFQMKTAMSLEDLIGNILISSEKYASKVTSKLLELSQEGHGNSPLMKGLLRSLDRWCHELRWGVISIDELRRLRKQAGLTQDAMAKRLGISRRHYVRYELEKEKTKITKSIADAAYDLSREK